MNVQLVLIDRPRTSRSSALEATLDLEEDSRAVAEMQIGVKHVALEKVAAVIFRSPTPIRIAEQDQAEAEGFEPSVEVLAPTTV